MLLETRQEKNRNQDTGHQLDSSSAPQSFRTFYHHYTADSDNNQTDSKSIGKPSPPLTRIEMELYHGRDQRTALHPLVDSIFCPGVRAKIAERKAATGKDYLSFYYMEASSYEIAE